MIAHPNRRDAAAYPLTLYYDGACPLCHGEMHNLMLRNTDGLLFVTALRRAAQRRAGASPCRNGICRRGE